MRLIGVAAVPALLDAVEVGNPASEIMRRRELIAIAGTGLVAWPLVARAQQQPKSARIGYLSFGDPAANSDRVEALRAGLRDLGYVEGKNLVIEFRWAPTVDELNKAAAELVRMKVDIIFSPSSTETEPGPTSNQHNPHRLRDAFRSRQCRPCGEPCAPRRQHHGGGGPRDRDYGQATRDP
jgi:hypothetical protein